MNFSRRIKLLSSALICATLAGSVLSAAVPLDLSSPRTAFDTYLEAMIAAKQGEADALNTAVACLDLSGIPPALRAQAGPQLARDLKNFLDRYELVDVGAMPVEIEEDRWIWRKLPAGEIGMVRDLDDEWRFSPATLSALPALLEVVEGRKFVAGIEGGGGAGAVTYGDWVRARVPDGAKQRFFLLELWQWAGLLGVALAGVIIDRIVRVILGAWLRRVWDRNPKMSRKVGDVRFDQPIGILVGAFVWSMLLRLLDLPLSASTALTVATQFVMAAAGVWAAYRFVDVVAVYLGSVASRTESTLDDLLVPLIRRALKVVIVAFGVVFIAQNLNINVSSLLAGLGIGGIAFALAAKDTVENLFGSVTVLIDRPFKIGDWVKINDLEGTVEELGLRSTRIRTFYNSLITVPNSTLVQASVDNLGERRYRRVKCMIAVQYDTPPDRIEAFCEGIRELIRRHPYTRKDYYMVYFNEFADSSLNILLYAFHETPDWATELRERHRLFTDIVRLAQRLGVEFAFPTRTVHMSGGSFARPVAELRDVGGEGESGGVVTPGAERAAEPRGHDDAMTLGREEAEAIVAGMWGDVPQPPVDFGRPERMRVEREPGSSA